MTIQNMPPATAWQQLQSGTITLIDVREPDEFSAAHIPYARSIPLQDLITTLPQLTQEGQPLLFQCQRGMRASNACNLVQSAVTGATIYNLEGGIEAWAAAGLPILRKSTRSVFPVMRQVQMIVGALVASCAFAGWMGIEAGTLFAMLFGLALMTAGITGWCGMALLLSKAPWNKR